MNPDSVYNITNYTYKTCPAQLKPVQSAASYYICLLKAIIASQKIAKLDGKPLKKANLAPTIYYMEVHTNFFYHCFFETLVFLLFKRFA